MALILRPPGTHAPLPEHLAGLGRVRRAVAAAGAGFALVGWVAAAVLAAGALDAAFHLPALARGFMLVGTLVGAGVLWLRLRAALRLPTEPLAVALELEDRFPRLNDSLASAVAFLDAGDDAAVSHRLRAAAVRKAERMADRLDLKELVPAGRCWRAFWACAAAVLLALGFGLSNTDRAATALTRLADPFGARPWPSKTRIEIQAPAAFPHRMPKGEPFELRFAVRGVIPEQATVEVRLADGRDFDEAFALAAGADPKYPGAAVVTARIDADRVQQSFTFRVVSNDGDTGWLPVAVAPPPKLTLLDGRPSPQIHVVPPAYTGLHAADLSDGAGVIEVPVGSRVTLRAAADVRLASAALAFQGDRSNVERAAGLAGFGQVNPAAALGSRLLADAVGADVPVTLSGDGRTLHLAFTPSMAGMYALRLTDETGLSGSRLLEVRLIPDPAPKVVLLRPSAGRDPTLLHPDAAVPVEVNAEDGVYALRRVFLEYRVGRDGPVHTVPLFDAPRVVEALPAVAGGLAASGGRPQPIRSEERLRLPVSAFVRPDGSPVRDGDVIVLRAAADDWDDVSVLKEPGRSGEVEIQVASRESIDVFLQKKLAELRPDLIRAREQQRDARQKAGEAAPRADGTLTPEDREKLLAAEQTQRQLRGKVADPRDGLRAKAEALRETARANALPRSNTTDRINSVADALGRLADHDLAAVEPLLGEARQKSAQPGSEKEVPGLLARAGRQQKDAEERIAELLELLAEWSGPAEIRADARVLRDAVNRQADGAERLPEKIPAGKSPENLDPNQRAELERAAGKLDLAAEQAGQLLPRAEKLAAEKDRQAADSRKQAGEKDATVDELRKKAAALPTESKDRKKLEQQADTLAADADDLRKAGDRAAAEAEALRNAVKAAGGQALPDELRRSAEALRNNRPGEATPAARSAAGRLDRMAGALAEKAENTVPELQKMKRAADQLDELGADQDELRKKVEEANRIADPAKRQEELQKLAREQERLLERTRELAQRLTREKADAAARDARAAADKMAAARDDLEQGKAPERSQADAVEKLDDARDKLDAAGDLAARELTGEKRRQLGDAVKAMLERHQAAVAEAARLQTKVLADRKWERPTLTSYGDLEDRNRALAAEVKTLADREFAELPVFARMLRDAAGAIDKAADRVKDRVEDAKDADPKTPFDPDLEKLNDDKVRRPLALATRRMEQLLDSLKDDPKKKDAKAAKKDGGGSPMPMGGGGGAGNADAVPPLTQLKALWALQAELNDRTAEFARDHPDPSMLTDEEREELKQIEADQRDMAALFDELAKLFPKQAPEIP